MEVTAAVLLAALIHAGWNAVAHRIPDRRAGFMLIGVACTVIGGAIALGSPLPAGAAWPFLGASAALHTGYLLLLMRSYQLGDFSQVYPLARGTSPLVVAVVAMIAIGEPLSTAHAAGVLAISAGLGVLVFSHSTLRRSNRAAITAAVLTGLFIAAYSVVDGVGVRGSGTTVGYVGWVFLMQGPLTPAILLSRGRLALVRLARPHLLAGLSVGVASVASYGIVLWAQSRTSLAAVAALRELSIVFGAIIGAFVYREGLGPRRVLGALLAVVGVALLNV